jgi:hypothetical protein
LFIKRSREKAFLPGLGISSSFSVRNVFMVRRINQHLGIRKTGRMVRVKQYAEWKNNKRE